MASSILRSRYALLALMLTGGAAQGCLQDDFDTACVIANNCDDSSVDSTAETSVADTAPDSRPDTGTSDSFDASDTAAEASGDADVGDGCKPIACPATACGTIDDGCGGKLDCPGCSTGKACDATSHTCVCKPITTCPTGLECGNVADGCGGTFVCPICTGGKTCNTTTNKCETTCTPATTCPSGKCGTIDNGCGTGTLSCSCTSPQTCGGSGTTGICGCTPSGSCGARVCGTVPDGCGGAITCGPLTGGCPSGQSCNSGGACVCASAPTCSGAARVACGTTIETCPIACNAGACVTATSVVVGSGHSCALMSDGSVRCWGSEDLAQVGDGSGTAKLTPTPTGTIPEAAISISAMATHTCIRTASKKAYCWGDNSNYGIGDGTKFVAPVPKLVTLVSGIEDICAGAGYSCALLSSGGVQCWGDNSQEQVGLDNSGVPFSATANPIGGLVTPTQIACGLYHACALDGGVVKCWGSASTGQLGDGTKGAYRFTAAATSPSITATSVYASYRTTCARLTDGSAKCWGDNTYSQLGDSAVEHLNPFSFGSVTGISAMSTGIFSCAVVSGGVSCAGTAGSVPSSITPASVAALAGATVVAPPAGYHLHGCAVISGNVQCWGTGTGSNLSGMLGDGTTVWHQTPAPVKWY